MQDLRQSPHYAKYLEFMGWKVEKIDNTNIFLKKIPLLGWFAKIQRPSVINDKIVDSVERKYHPFYFSIEPLKPININCFRLSKSPSLPTKTLHLDLTHPADNLLKNFSQKTRYNIKLSKTKNIKIINSKNILDFTTFWRKNFESKRFPFMSQQNNIIALHQAFGENSQALLAKKDNAIIAGLFVLFFDQVAYYMYAAANTEGRKFFAPTLLAWEAISLAKKRGCKIFDFDGIYDERFPLKSWLGFTKFKRGFGGKEITYPGIFTKSKLKFL